MEARQDLETIAAMKFANISLEEQQSIFLMAIQKLDGLDLVMLINRMNEYKDK